MSQISFTCSNNHPFKVPAKFAGKRAKCPQCGEVVTIPQVSTLNTTSKIIASNDDLETCGFTDGLSPLAASVANSYTQNPVATQPSTDVFRFWKIWAIFFTIFGLMGLATSWLHFNDSGKVIVMGGYILVIIVFFLVKPQISASMFAGVVALFTFWPLPEEKVEADSLAVTKTLDDNSALPRSNQSAVVNQQTSSKSLSTSSNTMTEGEWLSSKYQLERRIEEQKNKVDHLDKQPRDFLKPGYAEKLRILAKSKGKLISLYSEMENLLKEKPN